MRKHTSEEVLQVIDYVNMALVDLVAHPDFHQDMMDETIRLAQQTRYQFMEEMEILQVFRKLSWQSQRIIRDRLTELAKNQSDD